MKPTEYLAAHGKDIADAYARMLHTPESFFTRLTYDTFKGELLAQWDSMRQAVRVAPWIGHDAAQPYTNSDALFADIASNRRLFVYMGVDGLASNHPMSERIDDVWTINTIFRAVHDYYGHALNGYSFGPVGEECAYRAHRLMFSSAAQFALACETRAQSCAFNYGPDAHIPRNRRPFPIQKAGILPSFAVFTL